MFEEFSKVELLQKSNSMFLYPPPNIDTRVLKQIGDFKLGEELGSGAFGDIYFGENLKTKEVNTSKNVEMTLEDGKIITLENKGYNHFKD